MLRCGYKQKHTTRLFMFFGECGVASFGENGKFTFQKDRRGKGRKDKEREREHKEHVVSTATFRYCSLV